MYEIGTPGSLEASDWFDELALDPEAHPVAMGTRALGDHYKLGIQQGQGMPFLR